MLVKAPLGNRLSDEREVDSEILPTSDHSASDHTVPVHNGHTGTAEPSTPPPEGRPTEWREHQIVGIEHPQTVLLRTDLEESVIDTINSKPQLAYQSNGQPHFSLALILARMPLAHETNLSPLIRRSVLTFSVDVGLSKTLFDLLKAELLAADDSAAGTAPTLFPDARTEPKRVRRLFTRRVAYSLQWETDSTTLSNVEASGTEGRAGLTLHLNQEQTLDVLSALHGTPSNFKLCVKVEYRQSTEPVDLYLRGSWAEIYDYLLPHAQSDGRISSAQLHQLIPEMVQATVIRAMINNAAIDNPPADELVRAFMLQSIVILRKNSADRDSAEPWYTLRQRPNPFFALDSTLRTSGQAIKTLTLDASLDDLLGGALNGQSWDDFVHLLAEDSDQPDDDSGPASIDLDRIVRTERLHRVPKRSADRTTRTIGEIQPNNQRDIRSNSLAKMALVGNRLQSINNVSLLTSGLAINKQDIKLATLQPTLQMRPAHFNTGVVGPQVLLSDIQIGRPNQETKRRLPIITAPTELYWRDRVNAKNYWYAPTIQVVQPQPNGEASQSPFLFTFERIGTLPSGQPALRGSIKLTLQPTIDAATKQALDKAKITTAQAVPLVDVGVTLLIPFVDQNGQVRQHACVAQIEQQGDTIIATIELINDWMRLGYGALARQGFQSRPAEIAISYAFESYVPIKSKDIRLVFGGKAIQLPMAFSAAQARGLKGATFFDAETLTIRNPRFDIQLHPDKLKDPTGRARPIGASLPNTVITQPVTTTTQPATAALPMLAGQPLVATLPTITPTLNWQPQLLPILNQIKYGLQKQTRTRKTELLFPCEQLGHLYRERKNGQEHATGCRPIAALGRIDYQLYEELTGLRHVQYRVYRSLQQPGQFLVAPTRFYITRQSNDEGDQQAAILLYSHLDLQQPTNSRIQLDVTLQPDISLYQLRQLHDDLSALTPDPHVFYPTDVPTDNVDVIWNLDDEISDERTTNTLNAAGPFITANFSIQFLHWPLMQNMLEHGGISGSVSFTLPDGTQVVSSLLLHLGQIRGPWGIGPLDVQQNAGSVQLTNKTAQSVTVSDMLLYSQNGTRQTLPVESTLAPGASHNVTAAESDAAIYPVYSYPTGPPVTIEEVRSSVEELEQGIQFVNLINLASHNLKVLDIQARLQGTSTTYRTQLTPAMSTAEVNMILSLTTYLNSPILEYQVTLRFNGAADRTTAWLPWNLTNSTIVSLTSAQLGLG